jgi:hypothetical protein
LNARSFGWADAWRVIDCWREDDPLSSTVVTSGGKKLPKYITEEQMRAELREHGLPEDLIQYMTPIDVMSVDPDEVGDELELQVLAPRVRVSHPLGDVMLLSLQISCRPI